MTGETVRTPRGNFHVTDMSREQIEAAGFGFHHASDDGKYLIMGNGTQAYAIAAEQPQPTQREAGKRQLKISLPPCPTWTGICAGLQKQQ